MSEGKNKLCIIGDINCSTTRTYIEYLHVNNIAIAQLWLVSFWKEDKDKSLIRWVKNSWLFDSCKRVLLKDKPIRPIVNKKFTDICSHMQAEADVPVIDYSKNWNPNKYTRKVIYFEAEDINDKRVTARIKRNLGHIFLYTNGGIVNAETLGINDLKMLHVHPGKVPEWRGSDCFLWSASIRKKLGFSCFFMSAGIDEGDLIQTEDYDVPLIENLKELIRDHGEESIYNAILYSLDPHFRARLLCKVLIENQGNSWRTMKAYKQNQSVESPYLWIHPRLRERLLLSLSK